MKRLFAFALITTVGMFVSGCGSEAKKPPPDYKPGTSWSTSADKTKTPAAPAAPAKNP